MVVRKNNKWQLNQPGRLGGIANGEASDDAVNKSQLDALQLEVDNIESGSQTLAALSLTDTTDSTSSTTGTLKVSGGVGVVKNLYVGGTINGKVTVTDTGGAYATPVVLTTTQSGSKILVNAAAGLDFTLPAIAAADIGTTFEFFVTVSVTSNNFRVTAATGDLMTGSVLLVDDTAAYTAPQAVVKKPATSFLVMTMNGTTTGGKIGTMVRFTATSATQWFVEGTANGSGILATPFS